MLQATFVQKFEHKGKPRFAFHVTGSASELAEYKDNMGQWYHESDDGKVMWYTSIFKGVRQAELKLSRNGNYYLDTTEFDVAKAVIEANGGNLGQALANQLASSIAPTILGSSPAPSAEQPKLTPSEEQSEDDVSKL